MEKIQADIAEQIENVRTYLGIEFGSTRIKAVLIGPDFQSIASGSYEWENQLKNGYWTYSLDDVVKGLQLSYSMLAAEVKEKYGLSLKKVASIGVSAMMHGYLAFSKSGEQLVPFRTWRNATTGEAASKLTELFGYNIPERWSIAHLYQAILNQEAHVPQIDYLTTLAGYVHWQLTGEKVIGIGDASGMFPIDLKSKDYDENFIERFETLEKGISLRKILPKVLQAGENAGALTKAGAMLLDPSGQLEAGILVCPPEGDAGTGMVATNSVEVRRGNISVGTSAFAMLVLEKNLSKVYPEIDLVTTPDGHLVAMVHANNCTSDINAWVKLFEEYTEALGVNIARDKIFSLLFNKALEADKDTGGLISYGYFSGENITKMPEGRPLFVRQANSQLTLANFMKVHIASAFGAIRLGMNILLQEGIKIEGLVGHGGIFKTPAVGQSILAAAIQTPVTVMKTASEGGAWGMAILAAFAASGKKDLNLYLKNQVFINVEHTTLSPTLEDMESYNIFIKRYAAGLEIERQAVETLKEGL
ncbi:MAG: FGGY-family carbohydrate kinase [Streptococcaceae bacterium]|jgi:sugar (pentulose or hexulose) kinase|nr:FGGY-family carbohydrate kinase [Streptococcaceae bacterium]